MKVIINPSKLNGRVLAIASKSMAHRYLIAAALAGEESFITCHSTSEDILATIQCLQAMGTEIQKKEDGFLVKPAGKSRNTEGESAKASVLPCNESGSTLRFLLPVVGALGMEVRFLRKGRLPDRPLAPLDLEMEKKGCRLTQESDGQLFVTGQLMSGTYELPGNVSSQYISGLLFALPLLDGDSEILITSPLESADYVRMTISVIRAFGIHVEELGNKLLIEGGQRYMAPEKTEIEGDWSNAAFWLTAGAIGEGNIICDNLNQHSLQGDKKILPLLQKMGAHIELRTKKQKMLQTENLLQEIECHGNNHLQGIIIDAKPVPDLIPILAVAAAVSKGTTRVEHAERLRIKESDRIKTVCSTISQLGGSILETKDGMLINGQERLKGGIIDAAGDHRIAMMATIAATVCEGPVTILHAQAVNKSYPGFWKDYEKLGGRITLEN